MRKLALLALTDAYPYGHSENFFETELETLRQRFEPLVIVPSRRCDRTVVPREMPQDVVADLSHDDSAFDRLRRFVKVAKAGPRLAPWVAQELLDRREIWFHPTGLRLLAWYARHTLETLTDVTAAMERAKLDPERTVVYAYWCWPSALSAVLLKQLHPELITVARCHGGDLYEERHRPAYLPFRRKLAQHLDRIAFISNNGRDYFLNRWQYPSQQALIARLGVTTPGFRCEPSYGDRSAQVLELLTCSYVVPVKRLPMIAQIVSYVSKVRPELKVRWTHLGGGPQQATLEENARLIKGPNLTVRLVGHLKPAEVIEYYRKNRVDVFVNASSSEGIPVSIMEAFSTGVPAVAANVGGISELITPECGVMVPAKAQVKDFAEAILSCVASKEHHLALRTGALRRWRQHYDAQNNFSSFVDALYEADADRVQRLESNQRLQH
jgi:glycosyltransferase involved in cell wall biosynthesis